MTLTANELPSLDEPPEDRVPPSAVRQALRQRLAGRHPLSTAIVDKAVKASMAAVGLLPAPAGDRQSLQGATARALTEYPNCNIYQYDDTVLCIGGYVHRGYCNASKWHREDDKPTGDCPNWYLQSLQTRCNGRAAWRWMTPAGVTYRCADGEMWYKPCGAATYTHHYTICAARL